MSRLDDIRKRFEAATPGPWEVDGFDSGHSKYEMELWITTLENGDTICDMDGLARAGNEKYKDDGGADAWFIANARKDVEDLTSALEQILEYLEGCKEVQVPVRPDTIVKIVDYIVERKPLD